MAALVAVACAVVVGGCSSDNSSDPFDCTEEYNASFVSGLLCCYAEGELYNNGGGCGEGSTQIHSTCSCVEWCDPCEVGSHRDCPDGVPTFPEHMADRCCEAGELCTEPGFWIGHYDCIEWCDADTAPDAPDDPAPDPEDAVDAPEDPDDPDAEDVEDEG